ncbi:MAG TPA: hypothetical protein VF668_13250 [Pyrinomonadaceae bacterium]|jgi:hypothetical protein
MKTLSLSRAAAFLLLFFCACATAAAQPPQGARRPRRPAPRFEDYPVREVYRGPVAPVRLDSRRARMFRTRLGEGARGGPNFAGRYTVVVWGCGTGCAQMGVVDAVTGRVHFPPLDYADIPDMEDEAARSRWFRLDSRLLVLTRDHYDGRGGYTAFYYLFDGVRFRLLRKAEERRVPLADEPAGGAENRD